MGGMIKFRDTHLDEVHLLPRWRRPDMLLYVMAAAMPISFATWSALLNNFVIDVVHFDGVDIGWLQSFREVPGFLAIGVIVVLWVMREQVLALLSLMLLGAATAVTALFPSFGGLILVTLLSSIGFHYFQAVNQSLQLQWIDKAQAPQTLGRIVAIGSGASLGAYALLVLTWKSFDLSYEFVYAASGITTMLMVAAAALIYPQFHTREPQSKKFVLRRRYWLYYAITFMAGARRQIFVVFAAFMMVERFGLRVDEISALFLINYAVNMAAAPAMGRFVARFGERRALIAEYVGLTLLFLSYGGIYWFGWGLWVAAALYVIDHLLFALAFAQKTYFQKICDPGDIAPTAAVSFTINHIAAVFLPATLGYLWMISPGAVFGLAAGMAVISLGLALLVPRHPSKGYETVLQGLGPVPA
ncbi:MFS transporter [Thioclava atlantica]|uniref:Major facilitator superfamily protein n=1 Tax=Thioclava atlantica TaxID=1317124 RepID=A0A085TYI3_9RHOB|nr:MFS transporter [Thioclava atlantica]KFE35780.1 major facilitator superfamily protein [Thioclava atlantica]